MRRSLIAGALAGVLLLSGCGGAGAGSAGGGGGEADETATLRYGGIAEDPSSFDPHKATIGQDNEPLFLTYDRLVHMDPAGEPVPGLATEWEWDQAQRVLTMTLREGVAFHDGEPFNAEAAVANLLRVRDMPESTTRAELRMMTGIQATGEYEIALTVDRAAPQLPLVLSDRTGAMVSPAAFDNPDLDVKPVGSGMYKVTKYQPGSLITYEANGNYWDEDAVKLAGIEYHIMRDPQTRVNAIRSGQIDWTWVNPTDYQQFENNPTFKAEVFTSLSVRDLPMDRSNPALADERVRKALNYATDREALIKVLNAGVGEPCAQPFPPDYAAFDEKYGCDYYKFDQGKARELLAEAGYDKSNPLELEFVASPRYAQDLEPVQAMWAEVGIESTINVDSTVGDRWIIDRWGDVLAGVFTGRPSPFTTLSVQYLPDGVLNVGDHEQPEMTEAYNAALAVPDEDRQAELLREATGVAIEHALDIWLWPTSVPNVYSPKVTGVESYIGGKQEFRGVGMTR